MTALNGRLPSTSLVTVQGTMRLEKKAAASWKRLTAAIRSATRITALITSPDGAYRTYERQKSLSGKGNHQYKPGYSIHGFGRAVDIYNWATISTGTLDRIAADHGWKRTISNEPWHYEYSPNRDKHIPAPASAKSKKKENDDVYKQLIKTKDSSDPTKREYEACGLYGPVKIVGHAAGAEHNKQTGAPSSLDGTSTDKATKARVATVRALWAAYWKSNSEGVAALTRPAS